MTRLTQPASSSKAWILKSNATHAQLRSELRAERLRRQFQSYALASAAIVFLAWVVMG